MPINSQTFRKPIELLGAICGGLLIGMPMIPQATLAQQTTPKVNPCPSIFYQEPHNSRVVVPQGCPPNALTKRLAAQGLLPVPTTPSPEQTGLGVGGEAPTGTTNPNTGTLNESPSSALPEPNVRTPSSGEAPGTTVPLLPPRQTPVATIALANGKVNVRLVNTTGAKVTYQVIGDTPPRSLQGKSDVTLQNLNAPITVTFQRDDGGFLIVTPQPSSEPGVLELTFTEATNVAQDRSALRIERNGSVYLN